MPCACAGAAGVFEAAGAGPLASLYSAGMAGADARAAGSTVSAAVTLARPGTHSLSLQVW